ncbi:MAG: Riboflavin synthase [SAR116 cluster bacterium MED-G04]|nr:MAG: Riboflavin synthase [SAR116 cluster bacterium MED-G04]
MFTGIVTAIGRISRIDHNKGGDARFYIDTPWDCQSIALGASIACSGCCLTLVEAEGQGFAVDVSLETIAVTTLNTWEVGTEINLERALSMGDELGGHIVSGHVDGLGEIIDITRDGDGHRVVIDAPADLAHLIAPKGSVTLEGISLTVNEVDGRRFGIMVIPHTWDNTTLKHRQPGDKINLEADMLARYVARILNHGG